MLALVKEQEVPTMGEDNIKDMILETVEASLDAQLRAVRRLRKGEPEVGVPRRRKSLSQVDMAYDVLRKKGCPLHISELLAGIQARFGVRVDRESLVSSLSKKVSRGDRFVRAGKNTFGLHAKTGSR
jgi:hypothetical protein